ncbi:MAG: DUF4920 domain-containing protein [Pseudomonadota bacterium]
MRFAFPTALLVTTLTLSACGEQPTSTAPSSAAAKIVDTTVAATLPRLSDVVVLDVRSPDEFEAGHVPGAVNINIDSEDFGAQVAELDRDATYVVHCSKNVVDGRSARAMSTMQSLGFERLENLEGGIVAWMEADAPIEASDPVGGERDAQSDAQSGASVLRLSEPVASDDTTETFGSLIPDAPVIALRDVLARAEDHVGQPLVVSSRVGQVCQKKGCFFVAQDAEHAIRVSFTDYGFFVPTDTGGKRITMTGRLIARMRTTEEAAHYAEDLRNGTQTMAAGVVYEFEADGVRIPKV